MARPAFPIVQSTSNPTLAHDLPLNVLPPNVPPHALAAATPAEAPAPVPLLASLSGQVPALAPTMNE
ncbi:hypothetical protein FRC08_000219 [Ceratobasidium sp. 394]|nr:hypothetical protein FRC08_000219 [Ceratobasidium sp. 394]